MTRCHSVRSLRSPDARSLQVSLVASVKLTILLPAWVVRTSGSLPRLPMRMTLFTEPAMSLSLSFHRKKASGPRRQRPLVRGPWEPDGGAGTTACSARDQSHAQSRTAAGRRSSMARTHPLTRSEGRFRPQRHQRTRRRGRRLIQFSFLVYTAYYFRRVREANVRMFVRVEPDARGGGECILRVVAAPVPCART